MGPAPPSDLSRLFGHMYSRSLTPTYYSCSIIVLHADEAELAMRRMDTSGRGHLTNDKVYTLMREHFDDQRQLFKMKKVLIG